MKKKILFWLFIAIYAVMGSPMFGFSLGIGGRRSGFGIGVGPEGVGAGVRVGDGVGLSVGTPGYYDRGYYGPYYDPYYDDYYPYRSHRYHRPYVDNLYVEPSDTVVEEVVVEE